jgi:hypothetical protein
MGVCKKYTIKQILFRQWVEFGFPGNVTAGCYDRKLWVWKGNGSIDKVAIHRQIT